MAAAFGTAPPSFGGTTVGAISSSAGAAIPPPVAAAPAAGQPPVPLQQPPAPPLYPGGGGGFAATTVSVPPPPHAPLRLHTTPAPLKVVLLGAAACLALTVAAVLPALCLYRQQCSAYATNGRATYGVAASDAVVPACVILLGFVVPLSLLASRTQLPGVAVAACGLVALAAVLLLAAGFGTLALLPASAELAAATWDTLSPASRATYGSVGALETEMRADMAAAAVAALVAAGFAVATAVAHAVQVRRMIVVWRVALATASWPMHRLGWCRVSPLAVLMDLPAGAGAGAGVPPWLAAACACRPPSVAVSYPDPCGCSRLRAIEMPAAGAGSPGWGGRAGFPLGGMMPWANRAPPPPPPPTQLPPGYPPGFGAPSHTSTLAGMPPAVPIGAAAAPGWPPAPAPAPAPVAQWGMLPGAAASPPHTPARP